ncbi:MAG: TonB-dependent receptor plug domain-containing protein, partial [Bacteroidota bacterium]
MRERHSVSNYLKAKFFLLALCYVSFGFGQKNISVQIISESNEPLIGVVAIKENSTFTAVTNTEGELKLEYSNLSDVFIFRYLSYTETIKTAEALLNEPIIVLEEENQILDEVVVIGRLDQRQEDLPYIIETVTAENIALTNPQTSADAVAQHGNVFVQKSQMGGGSPVLRGFEANKVLLVVDGIRLNNAIYRNGHLQNAITVDQAMLERTELIFGPNSLLYGSDALGGVIHFRTRMPKLAPGKKLNTSANFYTRYASANNEKSGHLDFNLGFKKWAFLTSFTYADFDDLRVGLNRKLAYENFGFRNQYVNIVNGEDI